MVAGSFAAGALACLSRTLDDWIFVETSDGLTELLPFVYSHLEPGCIVWLGFSTCEEVQFQEWKLLWNAPQKRSVTFFNVSNPESIKAGEVASISEISPISLKVEY